MKTLILLSSLFVSFSSFAADPVTAVPTPVLDKAKVDTMDQTLLSKPVDHDVCRADREKFCKDVKPGNGPHAKLECLKKNSASLSAACRSRLHIGK